MLHRSEEKLVGKIDEMVKTALDTVEIITVGK